MSKNKRTVESLYLELFSLRKQLRPLLEKRAKGVPLSLESWQKARSLYSRIVVVKSELCGQGYNPNIKLVQSKKQKTAGGKGKKRRLNGSRRSGGVGIYGLGAGIKIWR